jgi:hypothetical protein
MIKYDYNFQEISPEFNAAIQPNTTSTTQSVK